MKHGALLFILILLSLNNSWGQQETVNKILDKTHYAHTGGTALRSYQVEIKFKKFASIQPELFKEDSFLGMLDSLLFSMPDTAAQRMREEIGLMEESHLNEMSEMYRNERRLEYLDASQSKFAKLIIQTNKSRGASDSTKHIMVRDGRTIRSMTNPVEVIHIMLSGQCRLNYVGEVMVNNKLSYHIQLEQEKKWLDIYIDQKTYLFARIAIPQVDASLLMGKGPVFYQTIIDYHDYKKFNKNVLPCTIEDITTKNKYKRISLVYWSYINKPHSPDAFSRPVGRGEKSRTVNIGAGLWVMERTNSLQNDRLLIRQRKSNELDIVTDISNNKVSNQKVLDELAIQFPEYQIRGLFGVQHVSGVASLGGFLEKNAHIYAPKARGYFSEERGFQISGEDSIWKELRLKKVVTTFEKEFEIDGVSVLSMMPIFPDELSNQVVSYYFIEEKLIYLYGNPYSADLSSKNASLWEKRLYDRIKESKISVDKIVYSGAYMDNAPLVMSFEVFENRISTSDFSINK